MEGHGWCFILLFSRRKPGSLLPCSTLLPLTQRPVTVPPGLTSSLIGPLSFGFGGAYFKVKNHRVHVLTDVAVYTSKRPVRISESGLKGSQNLSANIGLGASMLRAHGATTREAFGGSQPRMLGSFLVLLEG